MRNQRRAPRATAAVVTLRAWRLRLPQPVRVGARRVARGAGELLELGALVGVLVGMNILFTKIFRLANGDVALYHTYALAFWTQPPLLHSFPVEYPPLSIIPFSLTLLPPIKDFLSVFNYWMIAIILLGYLGVRRFAGRRRALLYMLYLILGTMATILDRFDIVPALVTLAALWAAQRRRFADAYILLAVGVLLKLYPFFLIPLVAIEQWRALGAPNLWRLITDSSNGSQARRLPGRLRSAGARLWRSAPAWRVAEGMAFGLGLIALAYVGALMLNPSGALTGFGYAGDRPLQVESTPATLLWLGSVVGIPAHAVFSFSSLNYVGPLDTFLKPLSAVALVAGCLWTYWRQARGRLTIGQAFIACLCAVIVTNKIFSPQYLIWVVPFVAAVEGFDLVWIVICLMTTLIYPYLYGLRNPISTVTFGWSFMPAVALRNLLLLYVTLRALTRAAPRQPARNASATLAEAPMRTAPATPPTDADHATAALPASVCATSDLSGAPPADALSQRDDTATLHATHEADAEDQGNDQEGNNQQATPTLASQVADL